MRMYQHIHRRLKFYMFSVSYALVAIFVTHSQNSQHTALYGDFSDAAVSIQPLQ